MRLGLVRLLVVLAIGVGIAVVLVLTGGITGETTGQTTGDDAESAATQTFASVAHARRDLPQGHQITGDDVFGQSVPDWLTTSGRGVPTERALGAVTLRPILAGEMLSFVVVQLPDQSPNE